MSLRTKSLAGYLFVLLLIVIVGIIAAIQSGEVRKKVNYLANEVAEKVQLTDEFSSEILFMRLSVEKFIYLNKEEDNIAAKEKITNVLSILEKAEKQISDPEEIRILEEIRTLTQDYIKTYRNFVSRYDARNANKDTIYELGQETQEQLEKLPDASAGLQMIIKKFMHTRLETERYMADYDPLHFKTADARLNDILKDMKNAGTEMPEDIIYAIEDYKDGFEGLVSVSQKIDEDVKEYLLPFAPEISNLAQKINKSGWKEMGNARNEVVEKISSARKWVVIIITFTILLGIAAGLISANWVIRPVAKVIDGIISIAEGDLTIRLAIKTRDELGELVRAVNTMILRLGEAVGESVRISNELAETVSENAASMEETSASLEEMSAMTRQNADNANHADTLMKGLSDMARKANSAVSELTSSMRDISEASKETSKIIKTIDGIAFQTNLLALNASVEAARAGEAGVGFAVVANEVRNLAVQTAKAARDTSGLIESTIQTISKGARLVSNTNEAFSEMAETFARVSQLVTEISAASGDQALGIEQINKVVFETERITQQNAANSEKLNLLMSMFKTG